MKKKLLKRKQLSEIVKLKKENEKLKNRVTDLEKENKLLKGKLALNSKNSSMPPSSDFGRNKDKDKDKDKKKNKTPNLRKPSDKPSGGQKGHKGSTLNQKEDPEFTEKHPAPSECSCGCNLESVAVSKEIKRQVFEIPEPKIEVTEHVVEGKKCTISDFLTYSKYSCHHFIKNEQICIGVYHLGLI